MCNYFANTNYNNLSTIQKHPRLVLLFLEVIKGIPIA